MLIQCEKCQKTFKIDERKIPDDNTFVKCSNCSKPIILPKGGKVERETPSQSRMIECGKCGAQYMIPPERQTGETQSVRCGKCRHIFEMTPKGAEPKGKANGEPNRSVGAEGDADGRGLRDGERSPDSDDLGLNDISIPDENRVEVEGLFDDVETVESDLNGSEERPDADGGSFSTQPPSNATEEYLKSVDIKGDYEVDEREEKELPEMSEKRRRKFFIMPTRKRDRAEQPQKVDDELLEHWPEIQDETKAVHPERKSGKANLPERITAKLPAESPFKEKKAPRKKIRKKMQILLFILLLLLLLATFGGLFLLKSDSPESVVPTTTQESLDLLKYGGKIAIQEPLGGDYVVNKASGGRIFVLQGRIKSTLPSELEIGSVKVKGTLYDSQKRVIGESVSFAGINLSKTKLETFDQEKIKSFYNYQLGEGSGNLNLAPNQVVPFQVVFFGVADKIATLEAKIVEISKNVPN